MQSRLTININLSYVKDFGATLRFLRALDPVAVVCVIDTLSAKPRVLELKAALPNAKVIVRCVIVVEDGKQLDGSMHLAPQNGQQWLVSPGAFLDKWGELGQGGLSLSYFNEPMIFKAQPADITRQVQHMIETIGLATTRGISLVVGNWGVGHYLTPDFDDVIEIMGKQRDLHTFGVHAYAPMDTFNCIDAILERCTARNFIKPRIGITEYGWDTTGNGDPLNGYKSQPSVNTGAKFANWEIEKFKNVHSPYMERGELEFIATFGWGYAASFPNDDTETDTDWQTAILDAASKGLLSVTTTPVTPIPIIVSPLKTKDIEYGGIYRLNMPGKIINAYVAATTGDRSLGTIPDNAVVEVGNVITVDRETWLQVKYPTGFSGYGWINIDLVTVRQTVTAPIVKPDDAPPPVVIPTPIIPDTPPPATPQPSIWARVYAAELAVAQAHLALAQLYRELDSETTARAA